MNDILDLSKLEAGRFDIEEIDFDLRDAIGKVIDLLWPRADDKGLTLNAEIPSGLETSVSGDPSRLRQILINLVGNAIKFTHEGEVSVHVAMEENEESTPTYLFSVSDTGIGIDDDAKKALFADFTQADSSISRKYGGTGLGLSISKRLIELMGGEIGVESEPGRGSRFWFRLPLKEASGTVERADRGRTVVSYETQRVLDILVADDNHVIQAIIGDILKRQGHRVEFVTTGLEALDAVQDDDFDLIVMDMRMPEMDGATATRHIREMQTDCAKVPIIACTADAMVDHQKKFFKAGVDACVVKPIEKSVLLETINQVVGETIHKAVLADMPLKKTEKEQEMVAEDDEDIASFLDKMENSISDELNFQQRQGRQKNERC